MSDGLDWFKNPFFDGTLSNVSSGSTKSWCASEIKPKSDAVVTKKLTPEIAFKGQPEHITHVAVDHDGVAWRYSIEPILLTHTHTTYGAGDVVLIGRGFDATGWENSAIKRDFDDFPAPKVLTPEIAFKDQPKWVKYAAVDPDGMAYAYSKKPELDDYLHEQIGGSSKHIGGGFDTTGWKASLIERNFNEFPYAKGTEVGHNHQPAWLLHTEITSGVNDSKDIKPFVKPLVSHKEWVESVLLSSINRVIYIPANDKTMRCIIVLSSGIHVDGHGEDTTGAYQSAYDTAYEELFERLVQYGLDYGGTSCT